MFVVDLLRRIKQTLKLQMKEIPCLSNDAFMLHDQMQFDLETNSRSPETKHGIETALLMTFTGAHPGDGDDNNSLER